MEKQKKVEKLHKEIRRCKKCSLWKTRTNAVPGEGNVNAKILFLGEAPGGIEDKTGRPFVGQAGKLLDKLLKKNRINRKRVFITSVVKCRPVAKGANRKYKNRTPNKKELKICQSWWQKQIDIIKPKLIVLLGKTAYDTVVTDKKNGDRWGKFFKNNNQKYFLVYHPAAGIRFQKFKKVLEKDFRKLKSI